MAESFPPIGMSPSVWGPIFWTTMHIVTLGYPHHPSDDERAGAAMFFNSLAQVIPCPICKEHYRAFLSRMPVEAATRSRNTLIRWAFDLHNKVNEQLEKPTISFDQFIANMQALANSQRITLPPSRATNAAFWIMSATVGIAAIGGLYMYVRSR